MRFFDRPDTVRIAREAFDASGYTLDALTARLGPQVFAHLSAGETAPLVRATRAGDRLDVLARLFLVGEPVPAADARAALAPLALEEWVAGGLVDVDGDEAVGTLAIRPIGEAGDRLVAHDRPSQTGSLAADHVLGISASTMALAGATIRRPIDGAFDLGTGCGVQALYASDHSRRVVASDVNPRAVACATLTTELNGLSHVSVRHGDLFEPIGDERFDLIVANPPFVISPSRRYVFRDSGRPLDSLCRTIVQTAPRHLTDRGHAQLLASWAHVEGEEWQDRVAGWFAGTGCDAFVVGQGIVDTAEYAASLIEIGDDMPEYLRLFDSWMAYYRARRIVSIGRGVIVMQRTSAHQNWFEADVGPVELSFPSGEDVRRLVDARTYLRSLGEDGLLDARLRVADNVRLEQTSTRADGAWTPVSGQLRRIDGLAYAGAVDATTATLVAKYDGQRPVRAHLDELAAVLNAPVDTITPGALAIIRRLVEQGFLLPDSVT